jgi:hypothetical protein
MKIRITVLLCVTVCLAGLDGWLLYTNYNNKIIIRALNGEFEKVSALYNVEYLYKASKELIKLQLRYEHYPLNNCEAYTGSDTGKIVSFKTLINRPKLIFGSSGNMCPPCIEAVVEQLKEIIPDYLQNDDIIFVADIEKRLKNSYYGKQVVSFRNKKDFPLYNTGAPYLFILDEDMVIKMLFITDKSTPELTGEYLKAVKRLYFP